MILGLVCDLDGVILESADIKTRAFRELFSDHVENLDQIESYHVANAGVSRYVKIAHIRSKILNEPLRPGELDSLAARFSELVFQKVLAAPWVRGAPEFLAKRSRELPILIASGTPQGELDEIVKVRHLDRYVKKAYGSPTGKAEILGQIIGERGLSPSEVVFVGDSSSDHRAAAEVGVSFIGRVPAGHPNPFPAAGTRALVQDMAELDRVWSGLRGTGD